MLFQKKQILLDLWEDSLVRNMHILYININNEIESLCLYKRITGFPR